MTGDERADVERIVRAEHAAGDLAGAATRVLRSYGPEVLGFLVAALRDDREASEVYARACADLWVGLPAFRWECSLRTWLYTLARNAAHAYRRDPHRRRRVGLEEHPELDEIAARDRTATAPYLRSESKIRVRELRATLSPDDQMLLTLRVDRAMSWCEIALVMGDGDDPARAAAALRKRFERVKERLRAMVAPASP
ncbi:MAG TPA: sigma-70 family RNA polymerase sigma factor [Polyangiaceae bacterium]|jgi:RNA polymerase sigma-70 factor (ECF subfamily)